MPVSVPPPGSRGSRFPKLPSFIARFFGRHQLRSFRRKGGGHTPGGVPALMLETIGARSGELRHAMLGYLEDGPGAWLVIASLAGSARNPGWLHNLARNPLATVELGDGRPRRVEATTLEGPERDAVLERIAVEAPEYAKYLHVTDREMPVVRLREVASGGSTGTSAAPG